MVKNYLFSRKYLFDRNMRQFFGKCSQSHKCAFIKLMKCTQILQFSIFGCTTRLEPNLTVSRTAKTVFKGHTSAPGKKVSLEANTATYTQWHVVVLNRCS